MRALPKSTTISLRNASLAFLWFKFYTIESSTFKNKAQPSYSLIRKAFVLEYQTHHRIHLYFLHTIKHSWWILFTFLNYSWITTDYRLFSDAYFEHFLFTNLTPKPKKTQTNYCFTIRYNQSTKSHDRYLYTLNQKPLLCHFELKINAISIF